MPEFFNDFTSKILYGPPNSIRSNELMVLRVLKRRLIEGFHNSI